MLSIEFKRRIQVPLRNTRSKAIQFFKRPDNRPSKIIIIEPYKQNLQDRDTHNRNSQRFLVPLYLFIRRIVEYDLTNHIPFNHKIQHDIAMLHSLIDRGRNIIRILVQDLTLTINNSIIKLIQVSLFITVIIGDRVNALVDNHRIHPHIIDPADDRQRNNKLKYKAYNHHNSKCFLHPSTFLDTKRYPSFHTVTIYEGFAGSSSIS